MNTQEVINLISKGTNIFTLSPKQYNWIISVAKAENFYSFDGFNVYIKLADKKVYRIKVQTTRISGGSYGGKRGTGNFICEVFYNVKFNETGYTAFINTIDFKHYQNQGHKFEIY
jgi:hypothetical protein